MSWFTFRKKIVQNPSKKEWTQSELESIAAGRRAMLYSLNKQKCTPDQQAAHMRNIWEII